MTDRSRPLWTPDPAFAATTNMARFMDHANGRCGAGADSPEGLWRWSVTETDSFWNAVWDFCGVIG